MYLMNIWERGLHGNEGKILYRAEVNSWASAFDENSVSYGIVIKAYVILKETYFSYLILPKHLERHISSPIYERDVKKARKWIRKDARYKWASETREGALRSLYWRKRAYKINCERRLERSKQMYSHVKFECEKQNIDIYGDRA